MIESYSFGKIKVNSVTYTSDVILFPDHVQSDWWRIAGHKLHLEDIKGILKAKPEILVVGTGYFGLMKVLPETEEALKHEGIRVIVEKTKKAVKSYNNLSPSHRVIGAFHLTC